MEEVGFYNPRTKEKVIRKDRFEYWISKGAQPSATVHNLLIKEGILKTDKIDVHKKSKAVPVAPTAEAPKEAAAPASTEKPAEPTSEAPKEAAAPAPAEKPVEPAASA